MKQWHYSEMYQEKLKEAMKKKLGFHIQDYSITATPLSV
jgi:hypothetical protein